MATVKKQKPTRSNKKLTLDVLTKESKAYNKKRKIVLEDGRFTYIFENFSNKRIDAMFQDFSRFIDEYTRKTSDLNETTAQDYLGLHTLIWFSELTDRLDYSYEEKISIFEQLLENNMVEKIFNEFAKEDLELIGQRLVNKMNTYQTMIKNNVEHKKLLREAVEGSDVENKEEILAVLFGENLPVGDETVEQDI